ncbi:hypothetical protein ACH4C2_02145 [Streptomyces sp. NPDC018057]|uniref:hypothetical protein n=1 Tax=unclassified Streptomyces TaxID=2593676 RepID=UPI0037A9550B
MGRVTRRTAGFQVSSRLTWSFSARGGLGQARSPLVRRPGPARTASAAARCLSAALLRSVLRAARPGARPAAVRGRRSRRGRLR